VSEVYKYKVSGFEEPKTMEPIVAANSAVTPSRNHHYAAVSARLSQVKALPSHLSPEPIS
jgi:hypothetical protein